MANIIIASKEKMIKLVNGIYIVTGKAIEQKSFDDFEKAIVYFWD